MVRMGLSFSSFCVFETSRAASSFRVVVVPSRCFCAFRALRCNSFTSVSLVPLVAVEFPIGVGCVWVLAGCNSGGPPYSCRIPYTLYGLKKSRQKATTTATHTHNKRWRTKSRQMKTSRPKFFARFCHFSVSSTPSRSPASPLSSTRAVPSFLRFPRQQISARRNVPSHKSRLASHVRRHR